MVWGWFLTQFALNLGGLEAKVEDWKLQKPEVGAIWKDLEMSGGQNGRLEAPEARTLRMSGAIGSFQGSPRLDPPCIRQIAGRPHRRRPKVNGGVAGRGRVCCKG